jgi:hypothetical protein
VIQDWITTMGATTPLTNKREILKQIRVLTNHGQHAEASRLLQKYFPQLTMLSR